MLKSLVIGCSQFIHHALAWIAATRRIGGRYARLETSISDASRSLSFLTSDARYPATLEIMLNG
ncbi:hypothetical protein RMSM_01353 [Rhodopirellula maiorica SM1]|uniref:Uncharacterized protein n=1 Tax=Rhodopirellula maiorica SM1 TaxID=1265738 RepID=M5RR73_9BACT|nr:hypothetical protein RMSM_01353 [Rhodopirellula maiorica SM1]